MAISQYMPGRDCIDTRQACHRLSSTAINAVILCKEEETWITE